MGTTLTGTTPQDTYDSLIKVTDNGPLSGTLKALSDGLGNDSTLSLSTTAASIAGTLAVTGNATFDTTTLVVDATNNRVGIGTSAPAGNLHIAAAADTGIRIQAGASNLSYIDLADTASGTPAGSIAYNHITNAITFATDTNVERARITSNGLSFNGDTAAANALDDYEEGTWTPVFTMGTSGTITMDAVIGRYTKVGNLVTCTGFANIASVSSPVGELRLGGLPFTTGSGADAAVNLFIYNFGNTTALTAYQGLTSQSLNYAIIRGYNNGAQVQDIGANVIGGAGMIFTITYRV